MTSLLEFNARAALCRRLAMLEPDRRYIWLAEAERWSRLTKKGKHERRPLQRRGADTSVLRFVEPDVD